jgi:anti-sigma factor RsiW
MSKRGKHAAAGHVSDTDLVLFLDGELDGDRSRQVASHLDACWSCRARSAKVEAAIAAAV